MIQRRAPDPFPLFQRHGTPDDMDSLDANIEAVADTLIAALEHAKCKPVSAEPNRIKPEDARYLAYALAVHRTRRGKRLTEDHLRLLAAALAIERFSVRAAEFIGLAAIKEQDKFIAAVNIEVAEPGISENGLATRMRDNGMPVANKTVRFWRTLPQWQRQIQARRQLAEMALRIYRRRRIFRRRQYREGSDFQSQP